MMRLGHIVLDGLQPQIDGIETQLVSLSSEISNLEQRMDILESKDRSGVPRDFTTSLLISLGQLVDLLKTHAPPDSAVVVATVTSVAQRQLLGCVGDFIHIF